MTTAICPACKAGRPRELFRVYRDGVWLKTAQCRTCIADAQRAEHIRFKASRKLWSGK